MNVEKIADLAAMEIVGGQPTPEALNRELERVREIVARHVRPEWQPIATAPKDGSPILVCNVRSGYGGGWAVVRWERDDDDWYIEGRDRPDEVGGWALWDGKDAIDYPDFLGTIRGLRRDYAQPTHWMPLPTPPDTPSFPERDQ